MFYTDTLEFLTEQNENFFNIKKQAMILEHQAIINEDFSLLQEAENSFGQGVLNFLKRIRDKVVELFRKFFDFIRGIFKRKEPKKVEEEDKDKKHKIKYNYKATYMLDSYTTTISSFMKLRSIPGKGEIEEAKKDITELVNEKIKEIKEGREEAEITSSQIEKFVKMNNQVISKAKGFQSEVLARLDENYKDVDRMLKSIIKEGLDSQDKKAFIEIKTHSSSLLSKLSAVFLEELSFNLKQLQNIV